jgi:hypothetical protein
MIDDALERLRASNPVPDDVPAPAIDRVLARLAGDGPPRPRWRRRWRSGLAGAIVPALGVGTAVAVVVLAIFVPRHHSPTGPSGRVGAEGQLAAPGSRMLGVLFVGSVAFPASSHGIISLQQCYPCATGKSNAQVNRNWTVATDDGGRTWRARQTRLSIESVQFSGARDGWAIGGSAAANGRLVQAGYVSHDGGRTWAPAAAPAGWAINSVSVAGGTVWATASPRGSRGCSVTGACPTIVLRGSVTGSGLARVDSEPLSGEMTAQTFAAGANTAYVDAVRSYNQVQHLVTHDGGRSWLTLPRFCPLEAADTTLSVAGPTSTWKFCWNGGTTTLLGRSSDGGVHYRRFRIPAPAPRGAPYRFRAVSSQVAWEMTDHGDVFRITAGGARSQRVWTRSSSQRTPIKGVPVGLTVLSAATAYVTVVIPPLRHSHATGTYIAVYRTRDSGRTWQPLIVPLPAG